jgi:two-component system, LytTR family, response regulator
MSRREVNALQSKLKALVVDDEPLARRTLRLLLQQDPEVAVAGECADGLQALETMRKRDFDIVFLDVQMPGMNGFEVLEALGPDSVRAVVFVTAYDQYALKAFEVHAVDYLLKPFDDDRFYRALERAKEQLRRDGAHEFSSRILALLEDLGAASGAGNFPAHRQNPDYLQRIAVKGTGHVSYVKVDEIDWIQAAAQYVELHVGDKSHLMRESINRLESQLDPARFCRIHRSALVNLERVQEVRRDDLGGSMVVLHNGRTIPISRGRRDHLEQVLTGRPSGRR